MTRTESECETRVAFDHADVFGRLLLVWEINHLEEDPPEGEGRSARSDAWVAQEHEPAVVRVTGPVDGEGGLRHWVGEWLDPYWDIEVLSLPGLVEASSGCWMFGHSYSLDGLDEPTRLVVLPHDPELVAMVEDRETPYGVVVDWIRERGLLPEPPRADEEYSPADLDRIEEAYLEGGHAEGCGYRFAIGCECTCGRADTAAFLREHGREA